MPEYEVEVITGSNKYAGVFDHVYITLFGTDGQSERTELDKCVTNLITGKTGTYTIETSENLGKLLLVKLEKDPFLHFLEDEWYCAKIVVTSPEEEEILFPCYRWISRGELVELRGGKALKVYEENHDMLIEHREKELELKKSFYKWKELADGLPYINNFNDVSELPAEVRFSSSRSTEFNHSEMITGMELKLKGLFGSAEKWECMDDMRKIFWFKKTAMSEYVTKHWRDDEFFGYQFLNGVNPNVIKRCSELPSDFEVTEEMVAPFLAGGRSLEEEMERGKIFICDQKIMDEIEGREYNGEHLYVAAGFCLFYLNPAGKLMPIAIQLQQECCDENPIFLPSDSEADWLLAKMFIKNSHFMEHQAVHHLMNTHFLTEVCALATLRCLPTIHPLYKLLFPHFRYTLHINTAGRKDLFGPNGSLTMSSLGRDGMMELMRRSLADLTYSSLCLPENITARGLESIPNFYYRDDGLKLWKIINSFARAMVEYYYHSDSEIEDDSELQEWINEIHTYGFLENDDSGIPDHFHTINEVTKFVTMVIFTASAQHAAVNGGQFDYYSWAPNGSLLLHKPPPTTKGESCMDTILETLPNVGETVHFAATTWMLSDKYTDVVPLGTYPEERFDEHGPKHFIKEFQAELSYLSEEITARNLLLDVPYTYLDPAQIENSVTI